MKNSLKVPRLPKHLFVRPMLNTAVPDGTADAELFIKRVIARLEASHQANILTEYLFVALSSLDLQDRRRLVEMRQNLQA
jgi:hypothetical protein